MNEFSFCNVLRSVQSVEVDDALFNLEGTLEDVPKKEVKSIWANSSAG